MSRLLAAVDNTPNVKGKAQVGKGAIKKGYHSKIIVPNTRLLSCSLDIDGAVKAYYPNANRWDYALEYNDEVFFLEFHPAETSSVSIVLKKLQWLKKWLEEEAPKIDALKSNTCTPYYWIGSGSFNIIRNSSQYRELAQKKLLPITSWNYNILKRDN